MIANLIAGHWCQPHTPALPVYNPATEDVLDEVPLSGSAEVTQGVAAGIPPFNFPVMIPLWMMPLAVVAGNTFVLKPSERTPLGAVRLAELFQEAGFPPGVLNVVHGARETVEALIAAPEVQAVS